jgi:hypothetical protein
MPGVGKKRAGFFCCRNYFWTIDLGRHTLGCSVLFSQLALAAHLVNICMLMRYVNSSSEYKVHMFFASDAKI